MVFKLRRSLVFRDDFGAYLYDRNNHAYIPVKNKNIIHLLNLLSTRGLPYEEIKKLDNDSKKSFLYLLKKDWITDTEDNIEIEKRIENKWNQALDRLKEFSKKVPGSYFASPHAISLSLIGDCNLKCVHCFFSPDETRWKERIMNLSLANKILKDASENRVLRIDLIEGESMLYPHLYEFLKMAVNYNLGINLTTNGTVYRTDLRDIFELIKNNSDLISINVTLYSHREEIHDKITGVKGSFRKTTKFIEYLKQHNTPFNIVTTVMHINRNEIPRLALFAGSMNAKTFYLLQLLRVGKAFRFPNFPYHTFIKTVREAESVIRNNGYNTKIGFDTYWKGIEYANAMTKKYISPVLPPSEVFCKAGTMYIVIYPDGTVVPCDQLPLTFKLGNITNQTLQDIWFGEKRLRFLNVKYNSIPDACTNCPYKNFCLGGCLARRIAINPNNWRNTKDDGCPLTI